MAALSTDPTTPRPDDKAIWGFRDYDWELLLLLTTPFAPKGEIHPNVLLSGDAGVGMSFLSDIIALMSLPARARRIHTADSLGTVRACRPSS